MRRAAKRLTAVAALALGGGMLFQTSGGGCITFASTGALSGINFCFLFDCNGGGLFRPCGDPTTNADDLLQDCPQVGTGG